MKITLSDSIPRILETIADNKERKVTAIHIDDYQKSKGGRQSYRLKPMSYPQAIQRVTEQPLDFYLDEFERRGWDHLSKEVTLLKLDTIARANSDYQAGSTPAQPSTALGLNIHSHASHADQSLLVVKDVVVVFPEKTQPDINQAIFIAATGGYIAHFILKEKGFSSISWFFDA